MSISRSGERNPHVLFRGGKPHTEVSKDLIRKSRIGKTHSKETRLALSMLKGTTVYLYEINTENKYFLRDRFNSYRDVAKYLGISQSTVSRYVKSGDIFKGKYNFSRSLLKIEAL